MIDRLILYLAQWKACLKWHDVVHDDDGHYVTPPLSDLLAKLDRVALYGSKSSKVLKNMMNI